MTQKDRINDFVSRLLDSQLTEGQCAITLGKADPVNEDFKNNYKCNNEHASACSSNFKKCTNYGGQCFQAENAMECENKSEPIPRK